MAKKPLPPSTIITDPYDTIALYEELSSEQIQDKQKRKKLKAKAASSE